jgi:hypothetical protein
MLRPCWCFSALSRLPTLLPQEGLYLDVWQACRTQTGHRCLHVQATPVTLLGLSRRLPVQRVTHRLRTRTMQEEAIGETVQGSALMVVYLLIYKKL